MARIGWGCRALALLPAASVALFTQRPAFGVVQPDLVTASATLTNAVADYDGDGHLAGILALAIHVSAVNQSAERFESPTAGIALSRPAGWYTTSLETVQANRTRVRLADPELQQALQTRAPAPLFVFSKYPEPHPGLNPSIQVTLRPAGSLAGTAPTALLKIAVGTMQRALPDFTYVTPIRPTRVSGWPAAYLRATYTLKSTAGASYPVLTRIWIIPRGAFMFLVGMSGPPDGPDASEEEFKQALASIELQK